jgi:putative FmdB family regulatory protein
MPIYAYKCDSCGFAKDVLQKMSDSPLSVCPQCRESSFKKQLTAAGFQLKGSGWYVTDFRGGNNSASMSKHADTQASASGNTDGQSADAGAAFTSAGNSTPVSPAAAASTSAAPVGGKSAGGDASVKSS